MSQIEIINLDNPNPVNVDNNLQPQVQVQEQVEIPMQVAMMSEREFLSTVTQILECIQDNKPRACKIQIHQPTSDRIRNLRFTGNKARRCSQEQEAVLDLILSAHSGTLRLSTANEAFHQAAIQFVTNYVNTDIAFDYSSDFMVLSPELSGRATELLVSLKRDLSDNLKLLTSTKTPKTFVKRKLFLWVLSIVCTILGLIYGSTKPDCAELVKDIEGEENIKVFNAVCAAHVSFYVRTLASSIITSIANTLFFVYSFNDVLNCIFFCANRRRLIRIKAWIWLLSSLAIIISMSIFIRSYIDTVDSRDLPTGTDKKILDSLEEPDNLRDFLNSVFSNLFSLFLNLILYDDISAELKSLFGEFKDLIVSLWKKFVEKCKACWQSFKRNLAKFCDWCGAKCKQCFQWCKKTLPLCLGCLKKYCCCCCRCCTCRCCKKNRRVSI